MRTNTRFKLYNDILLYIITYVLCNATSFRMPLGISLGIFHTYNWHKLFYKSLMEIGFLPSIKVHYRTILTFIILVCFRIKKEQNKISSIKYYTRCRLTLFGCVCYSHYLWNLVTIWSLWCVCIILYNHYSNFNNIDIIYLQQIIVYLADR